MKDFLLLIGQNQHFDAPSLLLSEGRCRCCLTYGQRKYSPVCRDGEFGPLQALEQAPAEAGALMWLLAGDRLLQRVFSDRVSDHLPCGARLVPLRPR